jgi:hypothetical protein
VGEDSVNTGRRSGRYRETGRQAHFVFDAGVASQGADSVLSKGEEEGCREIGYGVERTTDCGWWQTEAEEEVINPWVQDESAGQARTNSHSTPQSALEISGS